MKLIFNKKDILWGGIILAVSDGFGAYLTGGFSWIRFFGLLVIGSTLYAVEIPTFFAWLENYTARRSKRAAVFQRSSCP
ncbi:MAG TPA: hypothetical protein ENI82_00205 [Bacteroidetes bacterium]|nr:hypothetical protein [Bacteroidota bacterium]